MTKLGIKEILMATAITVTAQVTVTAEIFNVPTATSVAPLTAQIATHETGYRITVIALVLTTATTDL